MPPDSPGLIASLFMVVLHKAGPQGCAHTQSHTTHGRRDTRPKTLRGPPAAAGEDCGRVRLPAGPSSAFTGRRGVVR